MQVPAGQSAGQGRAAQSRQESRRQEGQREEEGWRQPAHVPGARRHTAQGCAGVLFARAGRPHCPKCGKGLKYPNLQYEQKIITCYNCGFSLIDSKIINIKANSLHLKNQKKLLKILEYGYYKLNQRYYYSTFAHKT